MCSSLRFGYRFSCKGAEQQNGHRHRHHCQTAATILRRREKRRFCINAGVRIDLSSPRHSSSPRLKVNRLKCMVKEWIKISCGASLCQMRIAPEIFLVR